MKKNEEIKETKVKKYVQVTITIDPETAEKLEEYMRIEDLPRSRVISRILKRYFEMK